MRNRPKSVRTAAGPRQRAAAAEFSLRGAPRAALLLATTALGSSLLVAPAAAQNLPTGGSVAAGSVSMAQPSATQLNITQTSHSAVVNWQSFSIGQGYAVNIQQPGSTSALLNRVTGNTPSTIAGSLTSNGQVYLVNPNGIAITSTGVVNTGSFVASTLGISDADFMGGRRTFTGSGASAHVGNAGAISVGRGGYAALIGGTVSNSGRISVPLGRVGLGSGERVTLDFSGDGFLQVAMPTAAGGGGPLVANSGRIRANGGRVELSAATAREAARNAVNMSGVVQARSIGGRSGAIVIGGGAGGRVKVSGRLDASSRRGAGGAVTVTGRDIALQGARINVSGRTRGGNVNVGGGFRGQGPLQRAETVSVDAATAIRADGRAGSGGEVVIWSDAATYFHGGISARGGAASGDGGMAEVSSKGFLDFMGRVDLSAPNGTTGTLLLDPSDIVISNGVNDAVPSGSGPITFTGAGNASILNVTTLETALLTASVVVDATGGPGAGTGSITVQDAVTSVSGRSLVLNALTDIAINADLSIAGAITLATAGGNVTQLAGADITTPTLNLSTLGGNVTLNNAGNDVAALGTVSLGAGALSFVTSRAGGFNVGLATANGGISVTNAAGDLTTSAAIASNGNVSLRSMTGTLTLGGTVTSNNNGVTLRSSSALNTGAFLVSAPTAVTGDVTLISDAGTVIVGAGGLTVGDTLGIQIGPMLGLNVNLAITAPSIALAADVMTISAALNATGDISLGPVTAGRTVTIGDHGAFAGLWIDDTELAFLTSAASLSIGQNVLGATTAGSIQIGTATVGNAALNLFAGSGVSSANTFSVGGGSGALGVTAGGAVSLTTGALIGSLSGSTTSGNFSVLRSGGAAQTLTVNAVSTGGGDIAVRNFNGNLVVSGALSSGGGSIALGSNDGSGSTLTINAAVNAGAGAVHLFSSGGMSQGAGGIVTADDFSANTLGAGNIVLTASNVVSGNVTLLNDAGSASFTSTSGFVVGGNPGTVTVAGLNFSLPAQGIVTTGGNLTLTAGGTVTQAAGSNIISTGTLNVARFGATNPSVTLDNAGNTVTNVGSVNVGTGSFTLADTGGLSITGNATAGSYSLTTSSGSISQAGGTTITADTVSATTTGGGFTGVILTQATNAIGAVSGAADGLFGFAVASSTSMTANAITAAEGISLTVNGGASDISVNGLLSASAGRVTLGAGRNISQTATGGFSASQLQATASGSVDLTAGAINNSVGTLAGSAVGNFAYTQSANRALAIGNLGTGGVVSTTGDADVRSTANTLTVSSAVTASAAGGDVTLVSGGTLGLAADVTANAAGGTVTLGSTAGSIVQSAGRVAGFRLAAGAATNVDLSQSANAAGAGGFAASATSGFAVFTNTTGIQLDTVGALAGVVAGGTAVLATTSGSVTQTATGIVTAAALGLAVNSGSIVLDQANQVAGNFAVVNTALGSVTFRNTGAVSIGAVGPIATAGIQVPTLNGVESGNNLGNFVSLTSDTGGIVQSAGAANRLFARNLSLQTAGGNATLTNTSNQIGAIESASLGAGALNVFDSDGGLVANGLNATGGITLSAPGALTVRGFNDAGAATVSLTTTGAGSAITQITGNITAGTLSLTTNDGNATLTSATNALTNLGTVALGTGALNLADAGGLTLAGPVTANGGAQIRTTGGNLTIGAGGSVASAAAGDAIFLSTDADFINNAGAGALTAAGGRWLVASTDPANNTVGGLPFAFEQFSFVFGVTPVSQPAGNGLLYSTGAPPAAAAAGTASGQTASTLDPANPYAATSPFDVGAFGWTGSDPLGFTSAGGPDEDDLFWEDKRFGP